MEWLPARCAKQIVQSVFVSVDACYSTAVALSVRNGFRMTGLKIVGNGYI